MCEASSLSLSCSGLLLVFCFFETESPEPYFYVAKGNLEHLNVLPPPSKSWDYKCAPPHLSQHFWFSLLMSQREVGTLYKEIVCGAILIFDWQ